MDAQCKGKKFGHNFAFVGGPCLNCGISQNELSREFKPKKIKQVIKKPVDPAKGMHSEIHALAKDISEYCKEPKKFGLYLGIIKRIGHDKAYQIFSEIKQSKTIKSRAKIFMYLSKDKESKNDSTDRKRSK
jgi:hypothetical protein